MKGVENPKDPIEAMPSDTATSTASSVKPTSIALLLNTACEVSKASAIAKKQCGYARVLVSLKSSSFDS